MLYNEQWQTARVQALHDLSPTVREIVLQPEVGGVQAYAPGAHLQVQLLLGQGAQAKQQTRHYSLVGAGDGARWRIAVKRMDGGRGGSLAMWRLAVGDRLQVSGPNNHFPLDLGAPGYLLVAGGIGITPLVGMAEHLAAHTAKTGAALHMLYGARSQEEMVYAQQLQAVLGERLQLHQGSTAIDFAAAIAKLPQGGQLYTCGPVPMLEALKRAWSASDRPMPLLRFETFGSSGRFPAQNFTVRIPRQGLQFVVNAETSLLDALNEAGVQTISDCRRGECGLCAMDVLAHSGELDHRDVFLSEAEKASGQRICPCVSRAIGEITLDCAYRPDA